MARVSTTQPKPKTGGKRISRKKAAAAAPRRKSPAAKPIKPAKATVSRRRVSRTVTPSAPLAAPAAPQLPESYGTRRLFLVARDPRWLYAHWDFSREEQHALNRLAAKGRLTLRIFRGSLAGPRIALSELQADSRHWFVPVDSGGARYIAELGYVSKAGGWVSVAVSGAVATPPDTVAPESSVFFATIPSQTPVREVIPVIQILGVSVAQNVPPAEVVRQFEATEELPAAKLFPPEQQWTPRQALELARVVGPREVQARMEGELSSPAIVRLLPRRRRVHADWSSSPVGGWVNVAGWHERGGWSGGGWSGDLV